MEHLCRSITRAYGKLYKIAYEENEWVVTLGWMKCPKR